MGRSKNVPAAMAEGFDQQAHLSANVVDRSERQRVLDTDAAFEAEPVAELVAEPTLEPQARLFDGSVVERGTLRAL